MAVTTSAENPRDMARDNTGWRRGWLVGLAAGGAVLAYGLYALRPPNAVLLDQWQRELSQLPASEIEPRLVQIAALGDEGVPVLVTALNSSRPVLVQAAARRLEGLLEDWQQQPPAVRSGALAKLAATLAQQASTMEPDACRQSSWLAKQILLQPIDRQSIDGAQLVTDCEITLRVCAARLEKGVDPWQLTDGGRPVPTLATRDLVSLVDNSPAVMETSNPTIESTAPNAARASVSDAPEIDPRAPQEFMPLVPSSGLAAGEPSEALIPPPSRASVWSVNSDESPAPASARPAPAPARNESALDWSQLTDFQVMRQLNSPDMHVAGAAVHELTRRGFQPLHLQLAERLVAPDPNTRLELVTQLPALVGVDARPWLLLLSRDPDASVRAATVRLLATCNDPALQAEIERLAREETDDDVLRVVRQVRNASRDR